MYSIVRTIYIIPFVEDGLRAEPKRAIGKRKSNGTGKNYTAFQRKAGGRGSQPHTDKSGDWGFFDLEFFKQVAKGLQDRLGARNLNGEFQCAIGGELSLGLGGHEAS